MRGLSNNPQDAERQEVVQSFNPPCGCVAFSTDGQRRAMQQSQHVSIRLADAWPFQLVSTNCTSNARPQFQSALRMRGLFNLAAMLDNTYGGKICFNPPCGCVAFSTVGYVGLCIHFLYCFNPPCGCVAFSTRAGYSLDHLRLLVSIRLADAWPFQRHRAESGVWWGVGFNPPCGCVAFSTTGPRAGTAIILAVSIRLADAWPFQPSGATSTPGVSSSFQSALRMRGLFNPAILQIGGVADQFQSALRMRGLFN